MIFYYIICGFLPIIIFLLLARYILRNGIPFYYKGWKLQRWYCPGLYLSDDQLSEIVKSLRSVSYRSIGSMIKYPVMLADTPSKMRKELSNKLILQISKDGIVVGFHMAYISSFPHIHLGLIMIDKDYRGNGLQKLSSINILALSLDWFCWGFYISDVGYSSSGWRMFSENIGDVFPNLYYNIPKRSYHIDIVKKILQDHRTDTGISSNAIFDEESFVIIGSNSSIGGGASELIPFTSTRISRQSSIAHRILEELLDIEDEQIYVGYASMSFLLYRLSPIASGLLTLKWVILMSLILYHTFLVPNLRWYYFAGYRLMGFEIIFASIPIPSHSSPSRRSKPIELEQNERQLLRNQYSENSDSDNIDDDTNHKNRDSINSNNHNNRDNNNNNSTSHASDPDKQPKLSLKPYLKSVVSTVPLRLSNKPAIWICNHFSWIDMWAVKVLNPDVYIVAKKDLLDEAPPGWKRNGFRAAFDRCHFLWYDRDNKDATIRDTIKRILLIEQKPICIFAEGTSQRNGPPMKMHGGSIEIALECRVPIQLLCLRYNLPVGLDRKDDAMKNALQLIRLANKKVCIQILEEINIFENVKVADMNNDERKEVSHEREVKEEAEKESSSVNEVNIEKIRGRISQAYYDAADILEMSLRARHGVRASKANAKED